MSEEKKYDFTVDDCSACDVYDAMNELEDWTKSEFLVNVVYNLVGEDAFHETRMAMNQIRILMKNMLQYQYHQTRQTRRFIRTIFNDSEELDILIGPRKSMKKRLSDDVLDTCYSRARRDASEESGLVISTFPDERPVNWTLDNIKSYNYIVEFMKNWSYSERNYVFIEERRN